ncbi:T9SS type A sorting domain-containing protein [candidate division KSB1 bacterium]|nr:T9SS type A sorting domain-containing protein [candidate division KSB1 bacterium]
MTRRFLLLLFIFACQSFSFAQDSVDVTFYYKPAVNPGSVFVPGEFNNWGPNTNGTINANAPSRMNYDVANARWFKTVRLRVNGGGLAGAYQYRFNENGASSGWLSDPLNPRRNASDNDNSILYVKNPTIHYLIPNAVSGLVSGTTPQISAYIFPAKNGAIDTASLRLTIDNTTYGNLGANYNTATKLFTFTPPSALSSGMHKLRLLARTSTGAQNADSSTFIVNPPLVVEALPAGAKDGVNYINATTATAVLHAPRKNFVYVLGDFNNWQIDPAYFMKRTPDSSRYWITLTNLVPNRQYVYQYLVNGSLRIADPYADQISDPSNDRFITSATYPNLIQYPTGKTEEIASVLQTVQNVYNWQAANYKRPEQKDLVIYELLVRDFIAAHDYKTLIDTLGYLQRLGVNAIELLPPTEFEGNLSWGYNISFYFAPDKYYGPRFDLKRFIDECHKRNMAVIIDMVLQHSYGQHPLVRMYSTGAYGPPAPDNPWYNVTAPHTDFAFGYDFNHERQVTKDFVDRVNRYWLEEYRVDGFRFDFTRGFTNRPGNSGPRDNARIAVLKRMADQIWSVDSTAYVILEHLIDDNSEMKELAEYKRGMLLWGNLNRAYSQSAMGWLEDSGFSSDLAWGFYKTRGWNKPGLVTYMESHDEEWLMYRNLQYGRSSGNYSVKDLNTALDRMKLVAAFFLTLPGPKMLWQFGELGYDQALPNNGRTDPKPILWNYNTQPNRKNLYKVFAALLKLRNENEVFRSTATQVSMRVGQAQYDRRINLTHASMNVTIIGNFGVTARNVFPNFQSTGKWYNYFRGDSITVSDTQAAFNLLPGEFHIYTSKRLPPPEPGIVNEVVDQPAALVADFELQQNYPNPFNPSTQVRFTLPRASKVRMRVFDAMGREVAQLLNGALAAGPHTLLWNGQNEAGELVRSGVYFLRLEAGSEVAVRKMAVVR